MNEKKLLGIVYREVTIWLALAHRTDMARAYLADAIKNIRAALLKTKPIALVTKEAALCKHAVAAMGAIYTSRQEDMKLEGPGKEACHRLESLANAMQAKLVDNACLAKAEKGSTPMAEITLTEFAEWKEARIQLDEATMKAKGEVNRREQSEHIIDTHMRHQMCAYLQVFTDRESFWPAFRKLARRRFGKARYIRMTGQELDALRREAFKEATGEDLRV